MIGSQLGRVVLSSGQTSTEVPSADAQKASPDERGNYEELMDVIDGILRSTRPGDDENR